MFQIRCIVPCSWSTRGVISTRKLRRHIQVVCRSVSRPPASGEGEEQNPTVKNKRHHGHFLKLAIFDPVRRRSALADAESTVGAKEKPTDNQQPIGQSVEPQRAHGDCTGFPHQLVHCL
ncbi:unnamed protein product [Musa banksii]